MKKFFTFLLLMCSFAGYSQSTTVVISQVFGSGGNAGAPYNADFVELHNVSSVSQSLTGMSIQYASASNTGAWSGVSTLPAVTIPAGGFFSHSNECYRYQWFTFANTRLSGISNYFHEWVERKSGFGECNNSSFRVSNNSRSD